MRSDQSDLADSPQPQPSDKIAAHLTALIESTQDLIFSVDLNFRLVTFNQAFVDDIRKNWGVIAKAGMDAHDLLSSAEAELWTSHFARALKEGPFRTEHTLQDARYLELAFNPITENANLIGISVFGKDITERKRAKRDEQASEARFRALVEQAPSAIGIGRNGISLYFNRKYVEMFGLANAEDSIGKPLNEHWSPEWRPIIEERARQRTLGMPVPAEYEAIGQRTDGTQFPVHISVGRVELSDGPATLAFLTDITERKAAEEALRASEARFRSYFDLPLVGTAITSPEKGFVAVNDRICEILGYVRDELMHTTWEQITHPDDLKVDIDQFNRLLAGDIETYSLDKRFIRKNGQTIWTTIAVGCVRKPDGTVDHICANMQDISERKQAEEALQASEARFRGLFEQAPTAIGFSRHGTLLYVNPKYLEVYGLGTAEEVVGRPVAEQWAQEDRPLIETILHRHITEPGVVIAFEAMAQRADGSRFPVHADAANVDLPDGPASFAFLTDITERKAAEEALRRAEQEYRGIFEEAPEGIFKTLKGGKFLAMNSAGATMLGYASSEEAVGSILDSARDVWLNPDDRLRYVAILEETGEVRDFQAQFKCKDGTPIWVSISARKVAGQDGETLYYQGFFENLSETKRLEAELSEHLREVQVLSEMNVALLRASSEEELLREYCRIVVEIGGYRMAWVGLADNGPEKRVIPMAHFGHEDGYLSIVRITWDTSQSGQGPTGRSIRHREIVVAEDYSTYPGLTPFRPEASRRGYASSIAVPFHYSDQCMACLTVYGLKPNTWSHAERNLMEQVASALGFGIKTLRTAITRDLYQRDLHASLEQTIEVISETVDQRDPYTAGHQRRVADLCSRMAEKLGIDPNRIQGLRLAAAIHDLGKIGIPAEILAKPGRLTPTQFALLKEHAQLGYDILKNVRFPWPIADIIHQHHERLNGSGYPQGLNEDAILLESRILAVADVVEAMSSHRPYREARGIDVALDEILAERETLYDPQAVDACVALFREEGYRFPA